MLCWHARDFSRRGRAFRAKRRYKASMQQTSMGSAVQAMRCRVTTRIARTVRCACTSLQSAETHSSLKLTTRRQEFSFTTRMGEREATASPTQPRARSSFIQGARSACLRVVSQCSICTRGESAWLARLRDEALSAGSHAEKTTNLTFEMPKRPLDC